VRFMSSNQLSGLGEPSCISEPGLLVLQGNIPTTPSICASISPSPALPLKAANFKLALGLSLRLQSYSSPHTPAAAPLSVFWQADHVLVKEQLHLVEILKYSVMLCTEESRALWPVVKGFAEMKKTQAQRELSACQLETPEPGATPLSQDQISALSRGARTRYFKKQGAF